MFTGIVEEVGTLARIDRGDDSYGLAIEATTVLEGTRIGDSIAVDGVCLTVTALESTHFCVGLAPETLSRTTLGAMVVGSRVNLERSLTPTSRIGGHFVQGHIDGTGEIAARTQDADSVRLALQPSAPGLMRYVVDKGFIAVDGISLTVVEALEERFTLMLIAHTQEVTTLARKTIGDKVNLEVDILAKYVEKVGSRRSEVANKT